MTVKCNFECSHLHKWICGSNKNYYTCFKQNKIIQRKNPRDYLVFDKINVACIFSNGDENDEGLEKS